MAIIADDDPTRIDREWVWRMLSTEAYWHRWRTRGDVEAQLDAAWRVVGVYDKDSGEQIGFARAVSDGVNDAYLADVIVARAARGHGAGALLVQAMIDDGPGAQFRWTLFTGDAHGLYEKFGFGAPDATAMVRQGRRPVGR
ncbi:GNAT family N-acetyltransferase [Microbacterium sp. MYb72]|uniref:GNAT family N-acetyltransferase n=1 Tax=Microbacterium sp. MYb72 TaxID=1848693 RepID=UPI000CFC740E|nr:GNAT family N-acetyltransferase [Microbacterium sp. MYb72]PRB10385.1 GNAT family N-acetyltransferase [Microbacterium sp. MYb72]